jgi:YidC/Oxa1 family membrane protein insertase
MIAQQKMMTPPPADEQQAMQQKMMKYMMVFFGLMFYKVAAGLCVYFIASSLWGFAERKLLPKYKPKIDALPDFELTNKSGGGKSSSDGITTNRSGAKSQTAKARRRAERAAEPPPVETGVRGWFQTRRERFREWWAELLEQARKK